MELKIQGQGEAAALTYAAAASGKQSLLRIDLHAEDVRIKAISLQEGKLLLTLEGRLTQANMQPLAAVLEPSPTPEPKAPSLATTAEAVLPLESAALPPQAAAPDKDEKAASIAAPLSETQNAGERYGEPQSEIEAAAWQEMASPEVEPPAPKEKKSETPLAGEAPPLSSPPLLAAAEEDKREEILERMREARGHILPRLAEANMAAENEPAPTAIRYPVSYTHL
ncbi:MAG: hypothetical protein N3A66_03880, partial [Planctomycetota bacterium]|nr:hypothetical protein [Planctomycetota bacterium]